MGETVSRATQTYYTVVFEVAGTRVYIDPYTLESNAQKKQSELRELDAAENVRVIEHAGSVGGCSDTSDRTRTSCSVRATATKTSTHFTRPSLNGPWTTFPLRSPQSFETSGA
ncbi:hypothetical protein [Natrialba swarupiae]|uniref:Uncharacterized protein n=1 Tax=Natrialba swarupiae TaxID=2448032 RepID=A0A5D5AKZ0_9EURY|nr:hypothetical protein [Natrialba swarupiae]TYT60412.1 hypothetical protein FYC77_19055 [Natrialba swarupiae]